MKRKATDTGNSAKKKQCQGTRFDGGVSPLNLDEDSEGGSKDVAPQIKYAKEENMECPICFNQIRSTYPNWYRRFVCCGKRICNVCDNKYNSSSCPMCREPCLKGPKMLLQLWPHVFKEKSWAQIELSRYYNMGVHGLKKDHKMALRLITKAVEQKDDDAQYNLGLMYYHGDGVEKDAEKAIELFTKAAEKGHVPAQCKLGYMYITGDGVEEDKAKAVDLWAKAVEQGHSGAQYGLGYMYYNGDGVE